MVTDKMREVMKRRAVDAIQAEFTSCIDGLIREIESAHRLSHTDIIELDRIANRAARDYLNTLVKD